LVRGLEGGVFLPDHPFIAARNGVKTPQAHAAAHWDAMTAGLGVDIYVALERSGARWLLWGTYDHGPHNRQGRYLYERRLDGLPSMIGHPAPPNALWRRP
jgi:hypothetical protein